MIRIQMVRRRRKSHLVRRGDMAAILRHASPWGKRAGTCQPRRCQTPRAPIDTTEGLLYNRGAFPVVVILS
jgi:hypothetical protein